MPWWIWLLLAMALTMLELQITTSFFLLGFGIGALVVGLLVGTGLAGPAWVQWFLFSVFSVAAVLLLRRSVRTWSAPSPHEIDSLVGSEAVVLEDLPVGGVGKAELRGTTWTARSAGDQPLVKGQRCRVTRVEGITVWLQAP